MSSSGLFNMTLYISHCRYAHHRPMKHFEILLPALKQSYRSHSSTGVLRGRSDDVSSSVERDLAIVVVDLGTL
eukprot:768640-Hanusia_phi.AAC.16